MFEPFLSCKAFGLRDTPPSSYVELARRWSGQASLNPGPDGSMQWRSQTTLKINGDVWYASPDRLRFPTTNALISLGAMGDVQAYVFVSPFSVVSTSFTTAASRYVQQEGKGASVVYLALQLTRVMQHASQFMVRGVEWTDQNGVLHVVRAASPSFMPKGVPNTPSIKEYHAIEIDASGHWAKIDGDYNISLADVSVELPEVSKCLLTLFDKLREFTQIATP
jgi:hypothetical protein